MVNRGEVWWYEHPDAGRHPFVNLTRSEAIPVLTQVVAAPLTRTIRDIPTEVLVDESDGLSGPAVISTDSLTAIRVSLCTERITTLSSGRLRAVCEALRAALAC